MPDYDLGRAHGEVVITADTQGATRAMGEYQKATDDASDAASRQSRIEKELTERRRAATEAAQRRKDAEVEYKRVMADSTATAEQQIEAEQRRNKARAEHLQTARRAVEAERALRAEMAGNTEASEKFLRSITRSSNAVHEHTGKMREMRMEAEKLSRAMSGLSSMVTHTFMGLGRGLAILGGIGAAGGLAGLLGAGGTQGLVAGVAGIANVVAQFSGSLLLIPAAVSGAVASIAALTISFKGVGDALKNMDDVTKFNESLKKLGPSTREFVLQIFQFRDVFRGFKQTVQDGLFAPLIGEVEPLVRSLLPTLMEGLRSVTGAFGELGKGYAQFLRSPETVSVIATFLQNMAEALKAMMPGLTSFSEAMRTLTSVGSSFFMQLAQSFNSVAKSFNEWINGLNQSGKLQEWISNGISAFGQLGRSIRDITIAFANIFNAAGQSGGALKWLETISAKFREWTESVEGNTALTSFFAKVREATDALMPILKVALSAVASLVGSLTDTGISASGGMLSFFESLRGAIKVLGDALVASGPAIGDILATLGGALKGLVEAVGPHLPELFRTMNEVLKDLAPVIVTVAGAIATFLSNLTPTQIEWILGAAAALSAILAIAPALAAAIAALTSPVGLVLVALAAVIAIGVAVYQNWDTIKAKASELWEHLKTFGSWIAGVYITLWQTMVDGVKERWHDFTETIKNAIGDVGDWFGSLIGNAIDWGKKLISNFANGLIDSIPGLRTVIDTIGKLFPDSWETNSPAKRGPLNRVSPNEMGVKLVRNLAQGISSERRTAEGAADGISSGVGTRFTTAGISGRSGQGGAHQSGFEEWAHGLSDELSGWSNLFQHATEIALSLLDMGVNTAKAIVNIMNIGKKNQNLPEQKSVEGVPSAPPPTPSPKGSTPDLPTQVFTVGARTSLPAAPVGGGGPGGYMGDAALLAHIPKSGNEYRLEQEVDLTKGLGDCTSAIEDLVNIIDGQPTGGRNMYTGNAADWLNQRGFLPTDSLVPGAFNVGYWDTRANGGNGHMQATLPDGTHFNWGGPEAAALRGLTGGGAFDPYLDQQASANGVVVHHYYRPVNGPSDQPTPLDNGPLIGPGANGTNTGVVPWDPNTPLIGPGGNGNNTGDVVPWDPNTPLIGPGGEGVNKDLPSNLPGQVKPPEPHQGSGNAPGPIAAVAGDQGTQAMSILQQIESVASDVGTIIGDSFQVFNDIIANIDAGAGLTATMVRGLENSEDIYRSIDQIQTFITTAADVAKLTSSVTGMISKYMGAAGAGDTSGGTQAAAAAFGAASAIAGIVNTGLTTTNSMIDLGQEVYRTTTKYGAMFAGHILGGPDTGPLGGNVRMLLNTQTGEVMTYGEENSQLKNTKQLPKWFANAYGGNKPQPQVQQTQVNLYTGPGSDPKRLISDTMWLVNVGAPQTVSVAGRE